MALDLNGVRVLDHASPAVASALRLALPILTETAESLIETNCCHDTDGAPRPGSLEPDALEPVEDMLAAIRAGVAVLGEGAIHHDARDWFREVVRGARAL
jgi:hypothetical protein